MTPSEHEERERKYLVRGRPWEDARWAGRTESNSLTQGYLNLDVNRTVRVRTDNSNAFLTVKGKSKNDVRFECEYQIPLQDAIQLLELVDGGAISKIRHAIELPPFVWQVDEFLNENHGLVVAEVERPFPYVEWPPQPLPEFIGQDLTNLPESEGSRYFNSRLVRNPYKNWGAEHRAVDGSLPPAQ